MLAGLDELVPIVGPLLSAIPALAVALLASPGQALAVLVFYIVLQQLESNILLPNIMKAQADIPPLLAILALLAGGSLGGILGALVAIPLAGALQVLVVRLIAPTVRDGWGVGPASSHHSSPGA